MEAGEGRSERPAGDGQKHDVPRHLRLRDRARRPAFEAVACGKSDHIALAIERRRMGPLGEAGRMGKAGNLHLFGEELFAEIVRHT